MSRAGQAVFKGARTEFPAAEHWLVLCGAGNNGGDGYVVARLAREAGLRVSLLALRDPSALTGDAAGAARDWHRAGGAALARDTALPAGVDLVIDALLGTGLDRPVSDEWQAIIRQVNRLACPRVAVDVPSGLNADTGKVMGAAIRADLTVTFIGLKRGLYTADGPDHAGGVVFDELAVPEGVHADSGPAGWLLDACALSGLGRRARNSHKGHFGHVAVVGGNAGMAGAARLAGEAAMRSGAGLVTVATHPVHAHWLGLARPELMTRAAATAADVAQAVERASVIAVGPGLGVDDWSLGVMGACLDSGNPIVLDADGLNLLARAPRPLEQAVITPHPAEAGRLLDLATSEVQADRFAAAARLAERFRAVVALKGCGTVVAHPDGRYAVCSLGNPGMATGGSGDVLTGVIAGLRAQGLDAWDAACLGVTAHAAAGDRAAEAGERGLLAGDIIAALRRVLND